MLKNVKVGDKVVGFPFGAGTVVQIEDWCTFKFNIKVDFKTQGGNTTNYTFSAEGKSVHWQGVVCCWAIKNAPEWIWGYFEKPKIKRPFEKWARVDEFGDVTSIFDTEEEMKSCAFRAPLSNRFNAKITGEIEYEVGD